MNIQEQFEQAITKKAIKEAFVKHVNLEELIEELSPKIRKEISAHIMSSIREVDWIEYIQDTFADDKEFRLMLRNRIIKAFK